MEVDTLAEEPYITIPYSKGLLVLTGKEFRRAVRRGKAHQRAAEHAQHARQRAEREQGRTDAARLMWIVS
jgi:hypothetical protein